MTSQTLQMPDAIMRQRVISEAEAASFIGFSLPHMRRLRREGRGPRHVAIGERRVGYRLGDLTAWLDARLAGSGQPKPAA